MKTRREFLLSMTAGLVALAVIAAPVIADELFGVITKVDVEGKKITVVGKGENEVEITVNDDTEYVTPKKSGKVDLKDLSKKVEKAKEKGKQGVRAKITHEKKVASKIEAVAKKKDAAKSE